MIKEPGVYKLKTEFFKENSISEMQYKRRKEDLMDWLKDFYDYEILEGKPLRIKIIEVYDEYKPLPRKVGSSVMKQHDYEEYVKRNLPIEYKHESKTHMAREAIADFGYDKYKHTSDKAVARRYTGPAMEKYGEHNENYQWVDSISYEVIDEKTLQIWKGILKEVGLLDEEGLVLILQKLRKKQSIKKELTMYETAILLMKDATGVIPVKVPEWRIKKTMLEYLK